MSLNRKYLIRMMNVEPDEITPELEHELLRSFAYEVSHAKESWTPELGACAWLLPQGEKVNRSWLVRLGNPPE